MLLLGKSVATLNDLKDTHKESAPSNKTQRKLFEHAKSMNNYIWATGTLNQIFIIDSSTQIKFSKKWSSQWQKSIFYDRSILFSSFNLS